MIDPADVAASYASLTAVHGDRFLMGIGVSHAPLIDSTEPGRYRKPLAATASFLDALDGAEQPVPVGARVLAALGPKMLELAANRSRGAHPYLVTPEHTHRAREVLGDGPLLLPEQTAILTDDATEARTIGTAWIRRYLAMPNYANNMLRLGFSPDDVASVSDRLLDAIIVWGDEATVIGRVNEHLSAGADHVCIQVLTANLKEYPARSGGASPLRCVSRDPPSSFGSGQHLANQLQVGVRVKEREPADRFAFPLRRRDERNLIRVQPLRPCVVVLRLPAEPAEQDHP